MTRAKTLQDIKILALSAFLALGGALNCTEAKARDLQVAVVAGGCFWCVEADFEQVPGVLEVVSGYTGGTLDNPTYKQVTKGGTGHYEAVQIRFDADRVSYRTLMDMFFRSVDPTDAGGQFCDRGESYRTAIFVQGAAQKQAAEAAKGAAKAALGRKIVTPILNAGTFYKAEAYHQNYYKGQKRVLTRFGAIRQADAYKRYRTACGRDQKVRQLWGADAPFVHS